jgi:hypothetical protein
MVCRAMAFSPISVKVYTLFKIYFGENTPIHERTHGRHRVTIRFVLKNLAYRSEILLRLQTNYINCIDRLSELGLK